MFTHSPIKTNRLKAIALITCLLNIGCKTQVNIDTFDAVLSNENVEVKEAISAVMRKHKINTASLGVINNGQLLWQSHHGESSPGIPASPDTLYNAASLTKTITAETILQLVNNQKLSLDESMSRYWRDPDLEIDSRYNSEHTKLTARMALSHTTGFMNWRFFSDDYKLKLINPPGQVFGYSGEGFKYLAKYAENKLAQPFESLVQSIIFEPLSIKDAFMSVNKDNYQRIARPLDQSGKFYGYYCHPLGYCRDQKDFSAAGEMVITLADYAKFLTASIKSSGLVKSLIDQRNTIQGIEVDNKDIDCSLAPNAICPIQLGYGLGWSIADLNGDKLIGHRGSDWSAVTLAYYYQKSKNGLIIFLNAPNAAGIAAMVDILEILDPRSPELHGYKMRLARLRDPD